MAKISKAQAKIEYESSLHKSSRLILAIAQFFSLMPVQGTSYKHPDKLKFAWISLHTFFSFVIIALSILRAISSAAHAFADNQFTFLESVELVFHFSTILSMILFVSMAQKWPDISREWIRVEHMLYKYRASSNTTRSVLKITLSVLFFAVVEHMFAMSTNLHQTTLCDYTNYTVVDAYLQLESGVFYSYYSLKYNRWLGILLTITNKCATFSWSFMDIFVILVSINISGLFQRVINHIQHMKMLMPTNDIDWFEIRSNYSHIAMLVNYIDRQMSTVTLVCFCTNLYFICFQVLNFIRNYEHLTSVLYLSFSSLFLIGKMICVILISSQVYEKSREPLLLLFDIAHVEKLHEVNRFIQQISAEPITITGFQMFSVKRGIVLSIAGTIITYELVLLQFNENEPKIQSNAEAYLPCLRDYF